MSETALRDYLKNVETYYKAGIATEHTYRPALQRLLQSLGKVANALDSSSAPERSGPVMLRCAKHLSGWAQRCFAALSMTGCDCSNCQGLFFTIEPCLTDATKHLYHTYTMVR